MRFDSCLLLHSGEMDNYPPINEWKETLALLDSAGYTGIWAAEHHFFWDGWTNPAPTNPLMFGAFAAAQTKRLRIGQCGVCLPDWHPIRAAEDVAMLDHMSGGRVDFGAIPGLDNRVSGNFNRAADRRNREQNRSLFWESMDIIEQCWSGKPMRHKGKHYEFPMPGWFDTKKDVSTLDPRYFDPNGELTHLGVVPTPLQKPTPPRWLMADSIESTTLAARRGMGVMSYAQSFDATRAAVAAYRAEAGQSGNSSAEHDNGPLRFALMRPIFVRESQAEAEEIMRPVINMTMKFGPKAGANETRKFFISPEETLSDEDLSMDWFDFLVKYNHTHVGTPDFVAERLARFRSELGIEHFVLFWAVPRLSFDDYKSSLRLFADKVIPQLT